MRTELPSVLGVGAWMNNAACLLERGVPAFSALHGDLGEAPACKALDVSVDRLLSQASQPVAAIAHDLHPDFYSTGLALRLAAERGVPAIAVQHHHAHIAAVMAEHGVTEPVVGLALDGVGLGTDGQAWGGELLWVDGPTCRRLGHLSPLALPGGDVAAREPWRMAASALHAMGRSDEIEARFGPVVGATLAQGVRQILQRGLNCPATSSAGRWFDAAAAALGLCTRQTGDAQAALALERAAERGLAVGDEPTGLDVARVDERGVLDLRPLLAHLLDSNHHRDHHSDHLRDQPRHRDAHHLDRNGCRHDHPAGAERVDRLAAWFHLALAQALAGWAISAARARNASTVCLGGGCFFNAVLTLQLVRRLQSEGLRVLWPQRHACGDAAIAMGQAWVAAQLVQRADRVPPVSRPASTESLSCA
jgi:hydrogenase maturation protein HypF